MRASGLISLFLLFLLLSFPLTLPAQQQSDTKQPQLTKTELLGRRILQQRCAVCHTQVALNNPMYGVSLNRDIVDGNEEIIRDYVRNGSRRMPGFKYGSEPGEIDAIVAYLKTVPKPSRPSVQPNGEGHVN
jgi:mono/diheme cytochrome c family protein